MGFKDFMYSEKGKLTTGILAAVLITTTVMVPVSIFADRAIRGDDSNVNAAAVQTWGYDDQVSSTAEKIDDYMEITKVWANNIYGGQQVLSAEPTLLNNSAYHTVNDDIEILDGVASETEALGYLSTSWIEGSEHGFDTLKIYDKELGTDTSDASNYLDPLDAAEKQTYADDTGLQATLNIHMKVPVEVANTITISSTGPVVDATGAADYYANIASKGYADDFAMQLGFFNYLVTDTSNDAYADSVVIPGTEVSSKADLTADTWTAMETVYTEIGGTNTLKEDVLAQQNQTSLYSIKIDGTGTNTGLIQAEVENYEQDLISAGVFADGELDLYYDLDNGGSGEGWKVSVADGGSTGSNARQDAFLGTQSRFSKTSTSEIANDFWGYDAAAYATTNDGITYNDPTTKTEGQVIGYTAGIDLPAFFINEDMTFDFQIKSIEAARALSIDPTTADTVADGYDIGAFIINGEEYAYGETIKVHPTGISSEGAREIYEFGGSWSQILDTGLMIGEIVK